MRKSYRRAGDNLLCCLPVPGSPLQDSFKQVKYFFFFINFNSLAPGPMLGAEHRGQMKSWVAWGTCSSKGRQTGK